MFNLFFSQALLLTLPAARGFRASRILQRFFSFLQTDMKIPASKLDKKEDESSIQATAADREITLSADLEKQLDASDQTSGMYVTDEFSSKDILRVIENLIRSISVLSGELKNFTKLLESQDTSKPLPVNEPPSKSPTKISLDFESYISKQLE